MHRPQLAIEQIATGEHWFGQQALALKLVDELSTSDDLILNAVKEQEVIEIKYQQKKKLAQRVGEQVESSSERILAKLLHKSRTPLM